MGLLECLFDSVDCNCYGLTCNCLSCPRCTRRLGRYNHMCKCGWTAPSQIQPPGGGNGSGEEGAGIPGIPGISLEGGGGIGPAVP